MQIDWSQFTPWTALAGGLLIGLGASLWALCNGRIAGISGLIASLLERQSDGLAEKAVFLGGLLVAPLVWSLWAPLPAFNLPVAEILLIPAGLLVEVGTRYASGCTSGHAVCGLARLSLRSLVATLCFMASAVGTLYVMRHVLGG